MEPHIRYAKTSDGVSIAYATAGEGRTVIRVPPVPWSHVQREWEDFSTFLVTKPLAETARTVWFDTRGSGLSDRHNHDFSIDALVLDLAAVVDEIGCTTCDLVAVWDGIPAALTYAAAHPEMVERLVLIEGYTKGSDYLESPAGQVELGIRDKDWALYTEMIARLIWGYDDPNHGRQVAEHFRACADADALRAVYDVVNEHWDVTDIAPRVRAPTLVINNENLNWLSPRAGQKLAALIPNARFRTIEDLTYDCVPSLIADFLELPLRTSESAATAIPGTAIILFADIADSTALTERLGDAAFRDRSRDLDEELRRAISSNGGTAIEGKLLGDGVLATFGAAREAIACASSFHGRAKRVGLGLHVGIHAGDVIRERAPDGRDNVYGGAVNIAARVASEAAAGETLVSQTVRDLARTSAGVSFEDRGERELKGVGEPIRVFAVRGEGPQETGS